jgi:hypothetical protein
VLYLAHIVEQHPELARVIEAWPELPEHIKQSIKALLETCKTTQSNE